MEPKMVGLFFVVDGQILMDAVPVEKGEPYGDTRGHGGHYDYWDSLSPANAVERRFKERAYDAYPRGRVVYFTQKDRFVLYADKCLKRDVLQSVAQRFGLSQVTFARDIHYQCANCNLDFLD